MRIAKYIIIVLILFFNNGYSQSNIFGIFKFENQEIQLNKDSTYIFIKKHNDTLRKSEGKFYVRNDTIILNPKDSSEQTQKLAIISYSSSKYITQNYISLIETLIKDSIFEGFYLESISNNGAPFFGYYLKHTDFYENENIKYKLKLIHDKTIITHYHSNGKIMAIKLFYKGKKNSNWYYFNEKGIICKIEVYKKDKLKKTLYE